ncbi:MAG: TerB-like [Chthonomonadaceae bacterium]|nr:TerB-like [Chthonomonadaceae bacterium]
MSETLTPDLYDLDLTVQVERYLPAEIRTGIEENYYARTRAQGMLDHFAQDPAFLENPGSHLALYTDHGPVHARDVARQVLRVLDIANGLLIPRRTAGRWEFMRGYAVMLAYIHDIGMMDNTPFGREMHAEFATQEVFSARFDAWIETIWNENSGNMAWRLLDLNRRGEMAQDPKRVLREMLSMANAHSKTKVPVAVLNDVQALRRTMQFALGMDLRSLHLKQQIDRVRSNAIPPPEVELDQETIEELAGSLLTAESRLQQGSGSPDLCNSPNREGQTHYQDYMQESFAWLVADQESMRNLVGDVVDTLRTLRCADSLRQRGSVLKTSGGYPIVLNRLTANHVYLLNCAGGEAFSVEAESIVSGEANLARCELTREGDLRASFLRGTFPHKHITRRAAHNLALVINDIHADAIESFLRAPHDSFACEEPLKTSREMRVLLEGVEDNLEFVPIVHAEIERINPAVARRVSLVASLHSVSERERTHYLNAEPVAWDVVTRRQFLDRLAVQGLRAECIALDQAFAEVRLAHLSEGDVLTEAGAPSGFVFLPMGAGLTGTPLGGYQPFSVQPWVPLGSGGIIRGGTRNATILAHTDVSVFIIPRETFLKHWFRPYSLSAFTDRLAQRHGSTEGTPPPESSACIF